MQSLRGLVLNIQLNGVNISAVHSWTIKSFQSVTENQNSLGTRFQLQSVINI